jgi:hypothetical protein
MHSHQTSLHDSHHDLFEALCQRKHLNADLFFQANLAVSDSMESHAAWCYQAIYSQPYRGDRFSTRSHHGIQHTARVAILTSVFANLYRRYDQDQALELTNDALKLIAIAALFHDAGREGDGVDYWDRDSGLLLYFYLKKTLQLSHEVSAHYAEAIANKDAKQKFVALTEQLQWVESPMRQKNIAEYLLHDADCLDIIRARSAFEAEHLDFYQLFAIQYSQAQDDLVALICEQRSVIAWQGDSYHNLDYKIKQRFNSVTAHSACVSSLSHCKLITELYANQKLLPMDMLKQEKVKVVKSGCDSPQDLLLKGKVFGRAIWVPTAFKRYDTSKSLTTIEIEKALEKSGNSHRSISLYGYGCSPCAQAGFLLLGELSNPIYKVSIIDLDTGWYNKYSATHSYKTPLTVDEKNRELNMLHQQVKLGGKIKYYGGGSTLGHNEILYLLTKFDAVFFSQEAGAHGRSFHANTPVIEAAFIRQEYFLKTGELLSLYEYSSKHNTLHFTPPMTEQELIEKWKIMCRDFLKKSYQVHETIDLTAIDLKLKSLRGPYPIPSQMLEHAPGVLAADCGFSQAFQDELSAALLAVKQEHLDALCQTFKDHILNMRLNKINIWQMLHFPKVYGDATHKLLLKQALQILLKANVVKKDFPSSSHQLFNGFSFSINNFHQLKSPLRLELMKSSYIPILFNRSAQLFLLADMCGFTEEKRMIQQQAIQYLTDLLRVEINDPYGDMLKYFAIAALFDIYQPMREKLLKHYVNSVSSRYSNYEVLNLFLSSSVNNLSIREAYLFNKLDLEEDTKQQVLGQWYESDELFAYRRYQRHPELNGLFANKSNAQLHQFMKSCDILDSEPLRKLSFFKAKNDTRKEYHQFVAQLVPLLSR